MLRELVEVTSIQDLITYEKNLPISHYTLHYKTNFLNNSNDKITINFSTVYDRYFDYIKKLSPSIVLTEGELLSYKYQPKKLSLNIYDTLDLWSLILRLNNMTSILEFNKRQLYLPIKQIFEFINEIMILEKSDILKNKSENPI